ncbi:hypothetical protein GCM10009545_45640 [Saccharopolyspora thermophila]|uniref:Uncharacterized protein n=1 Tax=Saccharopolyspora thermophila TaxID=89367 RepID=A0ABN1D9L8_9PSEU
MMSITARSVADPFGWQIPEGPHPARFPTTLRSRMCRASNQEPFAVPDHDAPEATTGTARLDAATTYAPAPTRSTSSAPPSRRWWT